MPAAFRPSSPNPLEGATAPAKAFAKTDRMAAATPIQEPSPNATKKDPIVGKKTTTRQNSPVDKQRVMQGTTVTVTYVVSYATSLGKNDIGVPTPGPIGVRQHLRGGAVLVTPWGLLTVTCWSCAFCLLMSKSLLLLLLSQRCSLQLWVFPTGILPAFTPCMLVVSLHQTASTALQPAHFALVSTRYHAITVPNSLYRSCTQCMLFYTDYHCSNHGAYYAVTVAAIRAVALTAYQTHFGCGITSQSHQAPTNAENKDSKHRFALVSAVPQSHRSSPVVNRSRLNVASNSIIIR